MPRMGWAEVDGTAYYFAHSYACETPHATAWSEGIVAEARAGLVPRRPVPSRRRAAPRARATSTGVLAEVRERFLSRA